MLNVIWPIIAVILLIILIVFLFLLKKKKIKTETDYRIFFILGLCFLPLGIAIKNYGIFFIGLVYSIIGLKHKKDWGKARKWSELNPEERKYKGGIIIALGILILASLLFYLAR